MSFKINVKKELGIAKSFEIKETNRNWINAVRFMRSGAKMAIERQQSGDEAQDMYDSLGDTEETLKGAIDYIANTLKLTETQTEKIYEDMNLDDTIQLAQRIAAGMLHIEMTEKTEEETGLKD